MDTQAVEPSNIIWKNLSVSMSVRTARSIGGWLVLLLLLLLSLGVNISITRTLSAPPPIVSAHDELHTSWSVCMLRARQLDYMLHGRPQIAAQSSCL